MSEQDRFAGFMAEVYGQEPFAWQAELAELLVTAPPPSTIDVPTGLGKTRVLAIWAYALSRRLELRSEPLPRRLCFVVDRRLIVDAARSDAEFLRDRLAEAAADGGREGVARSVAGNLAELTGTPLTVTAMRGGLAWDAVWMDRPDQPAIVVGTVDQFGSRLLFRGYGTSRSLRPIDAALVGTDSWLVIDEAHLAGPLTATTDSVARYQGIEEMPVAKGLVVTSMSATVPGGEGEDDAFVADLDHQISSVFESSAQVARLRIDAAKPARLVELAYHTGTAKSWRTKIQAVGKDLSTIALALAPPGGITAVVCNTIATARAVHSHLVGEKREAILLIGRCREYEKAMLLREWLPRIEAGSGERASDLFVVSTQTIEVGADLEFDALVTEAAPLSALIQRFGRVNRTGTRSPSMSAVVQIPVSHEEDPIYGAATMATWRLLSAEATVTVVESRSRLGDAVSELVESSADDAFVDFGLRASVERRSQVTAHSELEPEASFVPTLIGSHLERWAATSPVPLQDVDPAPFLHGVGRPATDVTVVWRVPPPDHLLESEDTLAAAWRKWLMLQPPRSLEGVDVPISEVRSLLTGGAPSSIPDLETLTIEEAVSTSASAQDGLPVGVVWNGNDEEDPPLVLSSGYVQDSASDQDRPRQLRPGETIVLDVGVGGHDRWGWSGRATDIVPDIGDLQLVGREPVWRRHIRWLDNVLRQLLPDHILEPSPDDAASPDDDIPPEPHELFSRAAPWAERFGSPPKNAKARWEPVGDALDGTERSILMIDLGPDWPPNPSNTPLHVEEEALAGISDESTVATSMLGPPSNSRAAGARTSLPTIRSHGLTVGRYARAFARNLALSESLIEAVGIAGEWHDLGKADARFQAALAGGDRLVVVDEPLAKSQLNARSPMARRARSAAGLPPRFRHEAVSARLVDELILRGALPDAVDPDLVRHLVVSHHGHSRPLLPALVDWNAVDVAITLPGLEAKVSGARLQVDWDQPSRFLQLNQRYGWWGLALLETIVRLADFKASKEGR